MKLKAGILGATGLVGQRYIEFLKNHEFFEITCLAASERSMGKKYKDVSKWHLTTPIPEDISGMVVEDVNESIIKKYGLDLVFSAVPTEIAKIEEKFAKHVPVFSKVSTYRMEKDVPLIVPEVNPDHMKLIEKQKKNRDFKGYIVTDPNCSTTGIVIPLKPLEDKFGIKSLSVTTMQALSGAGYSGVSSMQILDNIIPYIKKEEEKMEQEPLKILGKMEKDEIKNAEFKIYASCNRVNVLDGHLECVLVKLKEDFEVDEVKKILRGFNPLKSMNLPTSPDKPIIVLDEEDRPQPRMDRDAGRGMSVSVGRVEKKGDLLRFYSLSHNTIRGAAGESILDAEFAYKKGYI